MHHRDRYFSVDGKVVLLERGSKLIGETRGQVQQGSARLFVLWTEARTPGGVVVPLASPGTDALGRSGLDGEVDRHFWQRFGSAILISMVDVAAQAAQRSAGSGTVIYDTSSSQGVATEALRGSIRHRSHRHQASGRSNPDSGRARPGFPAGVPVARGGGIPLTRSRTPCTLSAPHLR